MFRSAKWLVIVWAIASAGPAFAEGASCRVPPPERPVPSGPAAAALERGRLAMQARDFAAAEAAFGEAEALARSEGVPRLTWIAAANRLRARVRGGASDEETRARLRQLATEVPDSDLQPVLWVNLARTWSELAEGDGREAARARREAADLLTRAATAAEARGDLHTLSFAEGGRGALYEAVGRWHEARTLTRRALLAAGRAQAPDAVARWHWQLGRIERSAGNAQAALAALRRAVRGLDALRSELAGGPAGDAFAFRESVEPIYLDLVDLLLTQSATSEDEAKRQRWLREARDTLEAWKAAELRDYYGDPCLEAQSQTAADEIPGTVVLYPVVLPDRVELIVGDAFGLSQYRAPVDADTLVRSVRRFRALLPKRTTRQYQPLAEQLYDWLIRPAAPSLDGAKIDALVVVPGGALRTIPFAALRDRRLGLYLIEKVAVATAPGLTLTDPRRIDAGRATVLAAGVSEAVQGYPALPGVSDEVREIDARFEGVTLVNADFEADAFAGALGDQAFDIVHIASHGEFRGNASESFILAYDEKLAMDRLGDVVGRTRLRTEQPVELLALSACQTAAGDDRAALGLAGVALRAGARSAIATLWSVSDEASATLIQTFYAELANGASRAEALRRAQRSLLETRAHRHPGYWAPFLLINSWL